MIKAVLFDAIDTLFQPWPDKVGTYVRIVELTTGLKVNRETMEAAWNKVLAETEAAARMESERGMEGKLAWVGFNANLLRELGYTGDCAAMGEKLQYESWGNPDNYHLFEDVLPTLKALQTKNIRIGCVSNEDGKLHTFFEKYSIQDYFEIVIASEEVGHEKPSAEIFEIALDKMKLAPHEIVFVGDSLISDYFGSKAVGMKAVLIDREHKVADDSICKIDSLEKIQELL